MFESSFDGGIVRVEYTDSVWFNSLYPSEDTEEITALTKLKHGPDARPDIEFRPDVRPVVRRRTPGRTLSLAGRSAGRWRP